MSVIRCSPWALMAAVLLADVAPSPSCGGRNEPTYLHVSALDCSCAPGRIEVTIDDRSAGELTCGPSDAVLAEVASGSHQVAATSGPLSWPPRTFSAAAGRTTRVDLGCPSPAR